MSETETENVAARFAALHDAFRAKRRWWEAHATPRLEAVAALAAPADREAHEIADRAQALKSLAKREKWRVRASNLVKKSVFAALAAHGPDGDARFPGALRAVRDTAPSVTHMGGDGRVMAALILMNREAPVEGFAPMLEAVRRGVWAGGRAHDASYAALFLVQDTSPEDARRRIDAARRALDGFARPLESPARQAALSPHEAGAFADRAKAIRAAAKKDPRFRRVTSGWACFLAAGEGDADALITDAGTAIEALRAIKPRSPHAQDQILAAALARTAAAPGGHAGSEAILQIALIIAQQTAMIAATSGAAAAAVSASG